VVLVLGGYRPAGRPDGGLPLPLLRSGGSCRRLRLWSLMLVVGSGEEEDIFIFGWITSSSGGGGEAGRRGGGKRGGSVVVLDSIVTCTQS